MECVVSWMVKMIRKENRLMALQRAFLFWGIVPGWDFYFLLEVQLKRLAENKYGYIGGYSSSLNIHLSERQGECIRI